MVLGLFDCQIDGFGWDEPVREDFLDRWKSDTFAVISVDNGNGEGVGEKTLIHCVSCLGGELDEVIKIIGS